jgi:hypothetical protein
MIRSISIACLAAVVAVPTLLPAAEETAPIRHRFLYQDESRHQLLYVDQQDPAGNWSLQPGTSPWDIQPVGQDRLLVVGNGFKVFDLKTRTAVEEFKAGDLGGIMSARRRPDGTTIVGANKDIAPKKPAIAVYELDRDHKVTRKAFFPGISALRMLRLSAANTILLAHQTGAAEVVFDPNAENGGRIVKELKLPTGGNAFQCLKLAADGHYLLSGGYAATLFEFGPDAKVVRQFKMTDLPAGLSNHFYSGCQVLKNGHVLIGQWSGHGKDDSTKGYQLIELDKDWKVVWTWHDAAMAGTALGAIILDDLDTKSFCDDTSGVMKEVPIATK